MQYRVSRHEYRGQRRSKFSQTCLLGHGIALSDSGKEVDTSAWAHTTTGSGLPSMGWLSRRTVLGLVRCEVVVLILFTSNDNRQVNGRPDYLLQYCGRVEKAVETLCGFHKRS
jgi:hypothetical protein